MKIGRRWPEGEMHRWGSYFGPVSLHSNDFFTGDLIDAAQAEKIGLVEMVAPADQLISSAEKLAKKLTNGPVTTGPIKRAINESLKMTLESSLDYVARLQYQLCHTEDHKEAVTSWIEKRKPVFKGK